MGLFKRVAGGSPLGNTFRAITNKVTGGILGNGLLLKKSSAEAVKMPQVVDAITSGFETVNEKMQNDNLTQTTKMNLQTRVIEWLKANKVTAILAGAGLAVVAFLYFKKRKGGKR